MTITRRLTPRMTRLLSRHCELGHRASSKGYEQTKEHSRDLNIADRNGENADERKQNKEHGRRKETRSRLSKKEKMGIEGQTKETVKSERRT